MTDPDEPTRTGDAPRAPISDPPPRRPGGVRLSDDLLALIQEAQGRRLSMKDIEAALRGRGMGMFILILGLPFCLPLPLMGISTPFGLAIVLLGLRLMLGLRPWLPRALLDRDIPGPTLQRVLLTTKKLAMLLERVVRTRWDFTRWPGMRHAIGAGIALSGLVLSLPILLPFTNTVPGIAIVLLALGWMEGDGMLTIAGFIFTAAALALVIALLALGKLGLESLGFACF